MQLMENPQNTSTLTVPNGNPSGFIVSPALGKTLVTGLSMQTANDAPDRDVKVVTLEGSNDAEVTAWDAGELGVDRSVG